MASGDVPYDSGSILKSLSVSSLAIVALSPFDAVKVNLQLLSERKRLGLHLAAPYTASAAFKRVVSKKEFWPNSSTNIAVLSNVLSFSFNQQFKKWLDDDNSDSSIDMIKRSVIGAFAGLCISPVIHPLENAISQVGKVIYGWNTSISVSQSISAISKGGAQSLYKYYGVSALHSAVYLGTYFGLSDSPYTTRLFGDIPLWREIRGRDSFGISAILMALPAAVASQVLAYPCETLKARLFFCSYTRHSYANVFEGFKRITRHEHSLLYKGYKIGPLYNGVRMVIPNALVLTFCQMSFLVAASALGSNVEDEVSTNRSTIAEVSTNRSTIAEEVLELILSVFWTSLIYDLFVFYKHYILPLSVLLY